MSEMRFLLLIVCLVLVAAPFSWGDVAFLLEEPFGTYGAMNPTGHAAIYLSRVCVDTPTRLRRCLPGEAGAVISRYHHIAGYDWIAIPLIPYLYAVDNQQQVPTGADSALVALLRDAYRRENLATVIPDEEGGRSPKGEWPQLIGAAYDRKIFGFRIEANETQDDQLISRLNSRSNRSHFNLLFHNCADFSRAVINFYYPKAVQRSFIADAGLTTPKQLAKSIVKFSEHHPELRFSAFVIPQVPGTTPRSKPVHGVYESLLKSKKYVVPLTILHPFLTSGMFAAYLVRGRFDPASYVDTNDSTLLPQHPRVTTLSPNSAAPTEQVFDGNVSTSP